VIRHVDVAERRARLVRRHGLVGPHASIPDLAGTLVGLHSSDPTSVFLAIACRHVVESPRDVEAALYEDRTIVRHLGMRRTLFTQHVDLLDAVQSGYTDFVLTKERRRAAGWFEDSGLTVDGERLIDDLSRRTFEHLVAGGPMTTRVLTRRVAGMDAKFMPPGGGPYIQPQSVGSRVLFLMATAGSIVRARPLGTWIASQYHWAPTEQWLGRSIRSIGPAEGRARVIGAWLRAFGPGTMTDLRWWTGSTVRDCTATLGDIGAVEVAVDTGPAWVLPDDTDPVAPVEPTARLLPGLDSTTMGWKERAWYLGERGGQLFDRTGNGGPTVWWDGRIVGGWAQRRSGEIVVHYLESVSAECRRAVDAEAAHLADWVGGTRFTPRFPSPLDTRLRSGA